MNYTDGSSGLFDKLGKLIVLINSLETFNFTTLQAIVDEIVTTVYASTTANETYARELKKKIFEANNSLNNISMQSMNMLLPLLNPILQQELDEEESFYSDDLNKMLIYLLYIMNRDSKSINQSSISTFTIADDAGNTGDHEVFISKYAPNEQDDELAGTL